MIQYGEGWLETNPTLVQTLISLSLGGSVAMMCVFLCRPQTMREAPWNYLVLLGFTLCESVLVGIVSIGYTKESLLLVFGVTAGSGGPLRLRVPDEVRHH